MPQPSRRGPPRMLQNVVKAIADLKNTEGCTMRNIISRINTLEEKRPHSRRPKDISLQVRKALKQGTDAGVIIHSARKYKLATTPSKCSNLLARSHASRRRKPRRRRSKSRRRRKSSTVSVSEASDLPSDLSTTTGGEVTESGRKRRKRSRSKRRRRRHRQQSFDEGSDEENERGAGKRPRRNRSNSNNEDEKALYADQQQSSQQECDNPDCLCNIKQHEDKQDSGGDDVNDDDLVKY